jgi:hypothetical protein
MENKNAIVALTRGYTDLSRYDVLIKRNISIYEKISVINNNFDVILFHEGNITDEQQNYIQSKTPLLPLKFFNVKEVGTKNAFNNSLNIVNNELCPPTQLSLSFSLGYKHMCHFWSIDFLQYLKNYKYIMRLDEDCIVTKIVNYRVLLNANYQNMVNNARIREGKEANFQSKESWFVKVNDGFNGSIVAKKSDTNCKYLLFACNDAKVEKYLIDGIEATSEQIDTINKFKSKPSKNTNQGLDYDVVVRTIKIDGIKEIKCGNFSVKVLQ